MGLDLTAASHVALPGQALQGETRFASLLVQDVSPL